LITYYQIEYEYDNQKQLNKKTATESSSTKTTLVAYFNIYYVKTPNESTNQLAYFIQSYIRKYLFLLKYF